MHGILILAELLQDVSMADIKAHVVIANVVRKLADAM